MVGSRHQCVTVLKFSMIVCLLIKNFKWTSLADTLTHNPKNYMNVFVVVLFNRLTEGYCIK